MTMETRQVIPLKPFCNDDKSLELIETLRNVTHLESPPEKILIVFTDSESVMYAPLKDKLSKEKALFMPLNFKSKRNIKDVYKNILVLGSASKMKFIVHAKNLDNLFKILEEFVTIFKDPWNLSRSIGVALSVHYDLKKEKVLTSLQLKLNSGKGNEITKFISSFVRSEPTIAVFDIRSANNNTRVDTFLSDIPYSGINKECNNYKFALDVHLQNEINCALFILHSKITSDVKRYEEERLMSSFGDLKDLPVAAKIMTKKQVAESHQYLQRFSQTMCDVKDTKSFLKNFQATFRGTLFEEHFEKTYFLPQNIYVVQILCATSSQKLTKPRENPETPTECYKTEAGDSLGLRSLDTKCVKISTDMKLQVRGKVVRISDIDIAQCAERVRFIEIFAEDRVLIDENLYLTGREMTVAIVAPVWEVVGDRRIVLDGEKGRAPDVDTAKNGTQKGNRNGDHGLAGLPGGSAGSFYGVADKIIQRDRLVISAVGGNGGKGQNGGNGAEGESGRSLGAFNCKEGTAEGDHEVYQIEGKNRERLVKNFKVFGTEGKRGGRGGNGGAKGLGGLAGRVSLFELSKSNGESSAIIAAREGNQGDAGYGGQGGLGGEYGNTMKAACSFLDLDLRIYFLASNGTRGTTGQMGNQGVSLNRRQMPRTPLVVQNFQQTVNEYKLYIRPLIVAANNRKEGSVSFYESLNTRTEITGQYDTLAIVDEFEGLERQVFNLQEKAKLTSSYTALQNRIDDYVKKPNYDKENVTEYMDVLRRLKSYVSEKLEKIDEKRPYPVVSNIENDLKYVIAQEKKLEEQEGINNLLILLDNKIALVNNLIEGAKIVINVELKSKMRDIETTLDQDIDSLLQEISELKRRSFAKEKELAESRQKLQSIMALKAVFGVMKIGCGLVSVINPALGIAATAVSSALSVVESQTTNYKLPEKAAELPKGVKALTTATEDFLKEAENKDKKKDEKKSENDLEEQKKRLSNMKEQASGFGKNLIDQIWNTTRGKIEKIDLETHIGKIEEIFETEEAEITAKLEKEQDSEKKKDYKIATTAVKYLKVANQLLQSGSDTIANYMKDDANVDEIDTALKANRANLKRLYTFEENVYNSTEPMLNKLVNLVDQSTESISTLDENQLLVTKWNVVSTMRDVQRKLKKALEGFNVTDDMNWTLEKLIFTFEKTIEMQERIEEYSKQKSDDKHKTMMHLAKDRGLFVSDIHLMTALARLKEATWQNNVRDLYEEWIDAFKQFAFPYSDNVLKSTLWQDSCTDKNISRCVDVMKNNIEKFNNLFFKERNFNKLLAHRRTANFFGSLDSNRGAFFVWSNDLSKDSIAGILSGNEIKLKAHIRKTDLDVVKFNQVEILFSSKNKKTQQKLNEVLRNFSVTLTHQGDSVYKFKNKTFEFETSPTVLEFRLPKTADKIPVEPSSIYEVVAKGAHMLSPYATWTIKLKEVFPNAGYKGFKALDEFKGHVDLELVGKGQFLDDYLCDSKCANDVLEYYKYL